MNIESGNGRKAACEFRFRRQALHGRNKILLAATATLCLTTAIRSSLAGTKYWDTSTASGLNAADGIWDTGTTANWSATTAGTTLTTFANGDSAYFQTAGTQNVTVSGTVSPLQILNVTNPTTTTISGGAINLGSGGVIRIHDRHEHAHH